MLARVQSAGLAGVDAHPVTLEVGLTSGLPSFTVVGLPQSAVREGRERVLSALRHAGVALPPRRITVNLAPADLRKTGTGFDLPLAVALLVAAGSLAPDHVSGWGFIGELGLDGRLRPARGALALALGCRAAGLGRVVVPPGNHAEVQAVRDLEVRSAPDLQGVGECLRGEAPWPAPPEPLPPAPPSEAPDLADVVGQGMAKRALEVAAAGGHNLLLVGPPGGGKTLLARRLPGLLPQLTEEEALDVTRIHSVAGILDGGAGVVTRRPFRAPHHTVTPAGLTGGGNPLRPGEVSLAHRGVLFLDELPEFRRAALEVLRQPLEDGRVHLVRAGRALAFPARFALVAAMNPCPCGLRGHPTRPCTCDPSQVRRYRARISGPLLDRIDLHVPVAPVPTDALASPPRSEPTSVVAERVRVARDVQRARLAPFALSCNAEMDGRILRRLARPGAAVVRLLQHAQDRLGISARAYHRILKVSRTLADLEGEPRIRERHAAEALHFRELDRPVD